MLLLGRSRRGNPIYISLPSPALEASRPIVHFLGFRASPKIPTFMRAAVFTREEEILEGTKVKRTSRSICL